MVKPLQDWLLIELEPAPEGRSGILFTASHQEPVRIAKVIAKGPGRRDKKGRLIPTEIQVGDRFPFLKAASDTSQGRALASHLPDGQELIRETDVLFVMDEDVEVSL